MSEAILIGAVIVGVLACPTMMWLGRRGIGPGCGMMGCKPGEPDETLDALKQRQRQLDTQVEELERNDRTAAKSA
ncbi:MAG: hypothetical protein WKF65_13480 [Gaiellaceae bacterium]